MKLTPVVAAVVLLLGGCGGGPAVDPGREACGQLAAGAYPANPSGLGALAAAAARSADPGVAAAGRAVLAATGEQVAPAVGGLVGRCRQAGWV